MNKLKYLKLLTNQYYFLCVYNIKTINTLQSSSYCLTVTSLCKFRDCFENILKISLKDMIRIKNIQKCQVNFQAFKFQLKKFINIYLF